MVEILNSDSINYEITEICDGSRRHLVIISPFLKVNEKLKKVIESAVRRGVKFTIIYGKRELDKKTLDWLKGLPYCNIGFLDNLHAKVVLNEEAAVMSSMNLYEYSQVNNHELGILAWMKDGKDEFKDILFNCIRMINVSTKQYGKWDIEDIDKPLQGRIRKETFFIPVTEVIGFDDKEETLIQSKETIICHCIRCGRSIPSYHDYVYCGRCLESWKQYGNTKYVEKGGHCYICGKTAQVSAEKPACQDCFRSNVNLVRDKCNSMNLSLKNKMH
jgi:hypothetical protein